MHSSALELKQFSRVPTNLHLSSSLGSGSSDDGDYSSSSGSGITSTTYYSNTSTPISSSSSQSRYSMFLSPNPPSSFQQYSHLTKTPKNFFSPTTGKMNQNNNNNNKANGNNNIKKTTTGTANNRPKPISSVAGKTVATTKRRVSFQRSKNIVHPKTPETPKYNGGDISDDDDNDGHDCDIDLSVLNQQFKTLNSLKNPSPNLNGKKKPTTSQIQQQQQQQQENKFTIDHSMKSVYGKSGEVFFVRSASNLNSYSNSNNKENNINTSNIITNNSNSIKNNVISKQQKRRQLEDSDSDDDNDEKEGLSDKDLFAIKRQLISSPGNKLNQTYREIIILEHLGKLANKTCNFIQLINYYKAMPSKSGSNISSNSNSNEMELKKYQYMHLILEYANLQSLAKYKSIHKEIKMSQMKSLIFQVLYALSIAQKDLEFAHNDLHLGNILLKSFPSEKKYIVIQDKLSSAVNNGYQQSNQHQHQEYRAWVIGGDWVIKLSDFGLSRITIPTTQEVVYNRKNQDTKTFNFYSDLCHFTKSLKTIKVSELASEPEKERKDYINLKRKMDLGLPPFKLLEHPFFDSLYQIPMDLTPQNAIRVCTDGVIPAEFPIPITSPLDVSSSSEFNSSIELGDDDTNTSIGSTNNTSFVEIDTPTITPLKSILKTPTQQSKINNNNNSNNKNKNNSVFKVPAPINRANVTPSPKTKTMNANNSSTIKITPIKTTPTKLTPIKFNFSSPPPSSTPSSPSTPLPPSTPSSPVTPTSPSSPFPRSTPPSPSPSPSPIKSLSTPSPKKISNGNQKRKVPGTPSYYSNSTMHSLTFYKNRTKKNSRLKSKLSSSPNTTSVDSDNNNNIDNNSDISSGDQQQQQPLFTIPPTPSYYDKSTMHSLAFYKNRTKKNSRLISKLASNNNNDNNDNNDNNGNSNNNDNNDNNDSSITITPISKKTKHSFSPIQTKVNLLSQLEDQNDNCNPTPKKIKTPLKTPVKTPLQTPTTTPVKSTTPIKSTPTTIEAAPQPSPKIVKKKVKKSSFNKLLAEWKSPVKPKPIKRRGIE
ncbi:hypothetical protein CYY_002100 [Polysphondylium violaceum]|uniref:Protein kinase domain-containing protein n=1 Tax=Polysphondylium violaceum TaxID=133409 RepID=A0A8J4Q262_9MYCE|nr:hypothetical protein CYY_002100 [Polysphondylium violaceum]